MIEPFTQSDIGSLSMQCSAVPGLARICEQSQHASAHVHCEALLSMLGGVEPSFSVLLQHLLMCAANENYGAEWAAYEGSSRAELPYLHQVASFIYDILERHPIYENYCSDHAWDSIQTTASKVSVTLKWLGGTEHLESKPSKHLTHEEAELVQVLWQVMGALLTRHMLDESLDMGQTPFDILMAATPCLGQPALQSFQPLTELVCAALRRIATDETLYLLNRKCEAKDGAMQGFLIFWVFLGKWSTSNS